MHMSTQGAILCILWAPAPGKTQGISLDPLLAARMIHLTRGHEWYTHRYLPLQPLNHAILIRLLGIKYVWIYSCNKGQSHLIFVVPRCHPEGIYVSQACLQASWKYGHFSYQRSNGHNGHIVTVWNSELWDVMHFLHISPFPYSSVWRNWLYLSSLSVQQGLIPLLVSFLLICPSALQILTSHFSQIA